MSRLTKSILIISLILIADQVLKIWIKTSMMLGDEIVVFKNWFILHFVENNGMAFGFEFAGEYGKMFLTVFRLVAVGAIGWYLVKLSKNKELPFGFIVSIALILAGALGNIIDSLFYGLIFEDSYGKVSAIFPDGGGYATFLHGKVVDMFYFPLLEGRYPSWIPFVGGDPFIFFRPVFNIADSSITIGIFLIMIFYRKYFNKPDVTDEDVDEESTTQTSETV
ncbi:MAG: lipoprotein signal peptidase [Draconibacterium sp.]